VVVAVALALIFVISMATSLMRQKVSLPFGDRVGVLEIQGVLDQSGEIVRQLKEFKEDRSIRGVLLRIDSPGGGVAASQEIYEEVIRVKEKKPVVVSMGAVAASGGYYIASPATKIVANPGTITGSIGAIIEFLNVRELAQKWGVELEVVKSGDQKDMGNPFREMTSEERGTLQGMVYDIQDQFVDVVAQNRGLEIPKVKAIADGRVFTGEKAKELGLVDELGGFETALKILGELAGIEGEPKKVYPKKELSFSFRDLFREETWVRWLSRSLENLSEIKIQYRYNPSHPS
jgi:protease-4